MDDRRRDGGTNSTLRIKEQETRLTLHEHDDNDDDDKNIRISASTEFRNELDFSHNLWSRGSVLAFSTQVHGFKPGRSRRIFKGEKNPQHAFLRRGSKAVGPMS